MKYNYNLKIFQTKDDIFYYLLGVFFTDGNIFSKDKTHLIQLTSKDIDWLKILQQELKCALYPTKDGHGNLAIRSKECCEILIENGCLPKKSLTNKLPNIPSNYLPDFIRGCIDGDGSIPKSKRKTCYLCSSSLDFLTSIKDILIENQIKCNVYLIKKKPYTLKNGKTITPKHPHYRLMMTGKAVEKFLAWIYYPNHKLSMPRKEGVARWAMGGTL